MRLTFPKNKKSEYIPLNLKTRLTMAILFLLVLFIAIILANSFIFNSMISSDTNKLILGSMKQANSSLSNIFEQAKQQAYHLSVQITDQEDFAKLLNHKDFALTDYEEVVVTNKCITQLSKIRLTSKIESVFVYSDNRNKLITSDSGVFNYKDISDYKWLTQAYSREMSGALKWVGNLGLPSTINKPHSNIVSLICKAHMVNRKIEAEVFLGINFFESTIRSILNDINITPNSIVYLIDQNSVIVSSTNEQSIGNDIGDIIEADFEIYNYGAFHKLHINEQANQLITDKNSETDWDIVVTIPNKELFARGRVMWMNIIILLCIVSIVIVLIAYKTIVKYVDKPVHEMLEFMKVVESGDFSIRTDEKRMDEFGALNLGLNRMVSRIDTLIRELYQVNISKRDIELKYLQKLIDPHFLYNTLDTVNWLANENRLSDVNSVTIALSNLYRTAFNRGQEFISLDKSVSVIKDYFYIYKIRFGELFSYEIKIADDLKNHIMLSHVLQPVVENALVHGIMKKEGGLGIVKVVFKLSNNHIKVSVYDNGRGIKDERLKLLRANIESKRKTEDSGLKIVNHRLKLTYGDEYGLKINSSFKKGTCVSFRFPVMKNLTPTQDK